MHQNDLKSQAKPPILFLPGLLNDARLFAMQSAALEAQGYGTQTLTLDFADTVTGLARGILNQSAIQPSGRFSLVALSMGGYVAFEIIRQLREAGEVDRLEKLVLLNTQARMDTEATRQQREGLIKLAQLGKFKGVTPRLLPRLLNSAALQDEHVTGLIRAMAEATGRDGFINQQRAILSRPDSLPLLPQIAVPTLVIGGRDDKLTPPAVIAEMAVTIPHAQMRILEQCGHLSPLEQADQVTTLLVEFFG